MFFFCLFVAEGLVLKGNPWTCDCSLVWLGHWLRRWLRETVQIHTVALEGAQQIQALAREAVCTDPRTGQQTPMIDLYAEDLNCHASALSRAVGGAGGGGGGGGIRHSATGLVATIVAVGVLFLTGGWPAPALLVRWTFLWLSLCQHTFVVLLARWCRRGRFYPEWPYQITVLVLRARLNVKKWSVICNFNENAMQCFVMRRDGGDIHC